MYQTTLLAGRVATPPARVTRLRHGSFPDNHSLADIFAERVIVAGCPDLYQENFNGSDLARYRTRAFHGCDPPDTHGRITETIAAWNIREVASLIQACG